MQYAIAHTAGLIPDAEPQRAVNGNQARRVCKEGKLRWVADAVDPFRKAVFIILRTVGPAQGYDHEASCTSIVWHGLVPWADI